MARKFNGTTDHIDSPTFFVPPAITLSCWFDPNSSSNAYNGIVIHDDSFGTADIYWENTGRMGYYLRATGGLVSVDPGTATVSNIWTHVAMSYDSSAGLKTYINAVSDGTAAANGTLNAGTSPKVGVGYDQGNAGRNFAGNITDVAEWNVSLTYREIYALSKGARPQSIRANNLLLWYPFDGYGHRAKDWSVWSRNGVLTGTTLIPGPPLISAGPIFVPQNIKNTSVAGGFNPAWAIQKNRVFDGVVS
jgi:hypothetical protein